MMALMVSLAQLAPSQEELGLVAIGCCVSDFFSEELSEKT